MHPCRFAGGSIRIYCEQSMVNNEPQAGPQRFSFPNLTKFSLILRRACDRIKLGYKDPKLCIDLPLGERRNKHDQQ